MEDGEARHQDAEEGDWLFAWEVDDGWIGSGRNGTTDGLCESEGIASRGSRDAVKFAEDGLNAGLRLECTEWRGGCVRKARGVGRIGKDQWKACSRDDSHVFGWGC